MLLARTMAAGVSMLAVVAAEAKVTLPSLVSDGMVLQRERSVNVWGCADAGETVQVKFVKEGNVAVWPVTLQGKRVKETLVVEADAAGRWQVTLPALKAGGPYTLQVNDVMIKDVWVGDVWLCSGQSNMELPVSRVTDMFAEEIAGYDNPKIRQFLVPKVYDFHTPRTELPAAAWKPCTGENKMNFSALGYFFAQALFEKTGVPVGIVNASWGGTPVEAWVSEEGLQEFPYYVNAKRLYEDDGYCRALKELEGQSFSRWNAALWQGDAGLHEVTPWYAYDYDDSAWRTVDLFSTEWGSTGLNPLNGSHWFRKTVELPRNWEGREAVLRLGCVVDADSVYVNGTFVGTVGYQYPPRIYRIPAGVLRAGRNNVTVRLISQGGYPHFVREKPYKILCGGEEVSLEGNWRYRLGAPMPNAPSMMFFCYQPVCLYNAMVAPLQPCTFRGVVWYQGESNVSRRNEYRVLLTAMMKDWRRTFGNETLPFYIVELADFLAKEDKGGRAAWAEMRKVQAETAEADPHARLIRNSDLGEWNDIHPLDKKTLGGRVADSVWQDMEEEKSTKNIR